MEDNEKAVESAGTAAAGQGVESAPKAPEADPEEVVAKLKAKLIEQSEQLAKAERDRDNYRAATLALKGKKEVEELDLTDPTQLQAYIQKSIEDAQTAKANKGSLETLLAEAEANAKKVKELSLALRSKEASTAIAGGSGAGSASNSRPVSTGYFSEEQVTELKKRGLNDAQIKRVEELSRAGNAATAPAR